MNAVEIEEAVSELVLQPFDPAEFAFQFLTAFGAKDTTLKRLRKGDSNASDVAGGVLQRNNVHLAVAPAGQVGATLAALRASARTTAQRAKFLLATDGVTVEAEDLVSNEAPIACPYTELPRHFGFFLPLAGISTVKEIKNNPIDVKATGRLNRLYVELLKDNPDWATEEKRAQLNQFMAQLIFCFFAEDTDIFHGSYKFTPTVDRMTSGQSDNTQAVIAELFRAMGTRPEHRAAGRFPTWADGFPYVNGGYLFSGATDSPRFSRTARAYLLRAGELDWKEINPDIFGSMIQAVADDGERGELGMHYTSVPNILKVLNPLFLDDLREQLEVAGDGRQKLRNLRKRLANIRVFDPACGSGNFLVIAYKEMRKIEAEIVARLGGEANLKLEERRSVIPLSNFYGIEIKGFAAEIARLALLIAEFQADCLYLSQQEARAMVLPLHKTGQIMVANALQIDWLEVCPPASGTLTEEHDLAGPTGRFALEDNLTSEGAATQTFICGNPPYLGGKSQSPEQKLDLENTFGRHAKVGELDYVAGWFKKASELVMSTPTRCAFVSTNSINQGAQVNQLWPGIFGNGVEISFAYEPFKWSNNATNKAAVLCTIIGLSRRGAHKKKLYDDLSVRDVDHIGPYLIPNQTVIVEQSLRPIASLPPMLTGNSPYDGGNLLLDSDERESLILSFPEALKFVRPLFGSSNYIAGQARYCIWVEDEDVDAAISIHPLQQRFLAVRRNRASGGEVAKGLVNYPYRFRYTHTAKHYAVIVPRVSSERREFIPAGILAREAIISDSAQALYDAETWVFSILVSKMHMAWAKTTSGRLKSDLRYSSALSYNTFPVPRLTDQNKADLTRTAENILLAREAHFPATIADLYDPDAMPDDLRRAHDENDEVLERIYIGRRFRNDTERLEKLFELYTKMTAEAPKATKGSKAA
ncbi:lactate dehydrogenase [Sphingomonas sp. AR_OL41]|uniref:class I SAM-dependent DNA methyltransferase n=1 Tax=Sphingomonas sp. AR_OL41 TaxID=3042729 RepID=UPI00247FE73F|nr:DNA methyltransferase [Sphingomonas sp. AR_OL41]MDH7972508.1 lactate dehydrogenase [Sphingomonas sp. AR_OL41]